jgi:hypothetical protein
MFQYSFGDMIKKIEERKNEKILDAFVGRLLHSGGVWFPLRQSFEAGPQSGRSPERQ